ncbi:MAG TPA: VWA domain-containing protein [Candidatus Acidoferrales bacterium]|nr:VWA domain-containing protein [Candidatus Acidoferrales bacterium]
MRRAKLHSRLAAAAAICAALALSALPAARAQKSKPKPPKPRQLDTQTNWHRHPSTGELEAPSTAVRGHANASPSRALVARVLLVPITCAALSENGDALPRLSPADFRVYDDGIERPIVYFHAPSDLPAEVALVIDASPSVLPDAGAMKAAAQALAASLDPEDRIGVVDFSEHTYLQLPLSPNRALLAAALDRVSVRSLLGDTGGSNIYRSVYLAAEKLFADRSSRKAIVLLTDGQDSGLGLSLAPHRSPRATGALTFDDVIQSLAARDIQMFVVSSENRPKLLTPAWLDAHRGTSLLDRSLLRQGIPSYTLFLAELVRRTGGELYFLRDDPAMSATFRRIAQRIRSEYWLGVSPAPSSARAAAPHPGWHALRVEMARDSAARVIYRPGYYVPASNP